MLTKSEKKLQEFITSDIYNCATPDLTQLRYNGPILLFLYGTKQTWSNITDFTTQHELEYGKDWYTTDDLNMIATKRLFLMFNNVSPNKDSYQWIQDEVCFPVTPVTQRIYPSNWFTPSQVRGRIISVSLRALTYFDFHFDNGRTSNRIGVKLYDTNDVKKQYTAMTYQHDHNRIVKVDEQTADLSFANGYKLEPYPTVSRNGEAVKRFTDYNGLNYTEASTRRVS